MPAQQHKTDPGEAVGTPSAEILRLHGAVILADFILTRFPEDDQLDIARLAVAAIWPGMIIRRQE